jgi:hypothetical protein
MTKIKQVIITETYHDIFTNLVAAFYRCKTRSRLKFKKIILFFIHTHEYEKNGQMFLSYATLIYNTYCT